MTWKRCEHCSYGRLMKRPGGGVRLKGGKSGASENSSLDEGGMIDPSG
jgi:hypothetical protein